MIDDPKGILDGFYTNFKIEDCAIKVALQPQDKTNSLQDVDYFSNDT